MTLKELFVSFTYFTLTRDLCTWRHLAQLNSWSWVNWISLHGFAKSITSSTCQRSVLSARDVSRDLFRLSRAFSSINLMCLLGWPFYMDNIYCYYSWFVNLLQLESISDMNAVLMVAFETHILHCCNFDVCGCCSGSFNFCHNCWTCVSKGRELKFGISNRIL